MLYLDVPYQEKDEAKALGARWNPDMKKWFVENKRNYYKFKKWFPKNFAEHYIVCDYIYLVEKVRKCPYCKVLNKEVKVAVPHYYYFFEEPDEFGNFFEYIAGQMPRIVSLKTIKRMLNGDLENILKNRYSITLSNNRLCQVCVACHKQIAISPSYSFEIYSMDEVEDFALYKFEIDEDFIVEDLEWCSSDVYIVKFAKKI